MATGCGVRRYIDFLILLIPTPLVYVLFTATSLNVFRSFRKKKRMPNHDFLLRAVRTLTCAI